LSNRYVPHGGCLLSAAVTLNSRKCSKIEKNDGFEIKAAILK